MPDKPPAKSGFLGKKIGGVKTQWWLLGGLGTAGAVYFYYSRQATTAATAATPTDAVPGDSSAVDSGYSSDPNAYDGDVYGSNYGGGYGSGNTQGYGGGSTTINVEAPKPLTDKHWLAEAEAKLEAHGYSKAAATAALTAYLVGAPLTQHQKGIVETAVGLVGVPPTGAPRVHSLPHTKSTPQKRHKAPVKRKLKHPTINTRHV